MPVAELVEEEDIEDGEEKKEIVLTVNRVESKKNTKR